MFAVGRGKTAYFPVPAKDMNDITRQRLQRAIEALPEAQMYQALDYVEFLASKYARQGTRTASGLQRFGERLEDSMRMHQVGFRAMKGTLGFVSAADRVVSNIVESGRSIVRDVEAGLSGAAEESRTRNLPARRDESPDLLRGVPDRPEDKQEE